MTQNAVIEVDCPGCGNRQTMDLCQSINADIDPELRTRLFEFNLNVFRCENCEHEAELDTPLLYHDMARQFTVQYFPADMLEDPEAFSDWNADGTYDLGIPQAGADHYMSRPHIVFDPNEMIRYIVFREMLTARDIS